MAHLRVAVCSTRLAVHRFTYLAAYMSPFSTMGKADHRASCFSAPLVTGIMYHIGVNNITPSQSIWSLGFGSLNADSLINSSSDRNSLVGIILVANLPQGVLALLSFMYNSTFTCMLPAAEWSRYARHRKGLCVSSPSHTQRSTYWLQLP